MWTKTILISAVFVCVISDTTDNDENSVKELLEEPYVSESVNFNFQVPKFNQVKDGEYEDLKKIILSLSNWFEDKLNETSFDVKHVNNKTKIYVKSFDFNVDFDEETKKTTKMTTTQETTTQSTTTTTMAPEISKINSFNSTLEGNITKIAELSQEIQIAVGRASEENDKLLKAYIDRKTNVERNEIYNTVEFDTTYYDEDEDDNSTDYPLIDYIEMYKDTTNEEYLYTGTELPTTLADVTLIEVDVNESDDLASSKMRNDALDLTCRGNTSCESFTTSVNPWVATIFVKNDSENSQFNYYCDGALLSEKVVLTGGRCTLLSGKQIEPKDILVFLGKGNLHVMDGNEQLHRINSVILHENYTERDGTAINDLALLVMEDPTSLEGNIQKACIHTDDGEDLEEAATTAWGPSGHLLPIFFEKEKSDLCFDRDDNIFCATYGLNVPLCPSYGGIYATKRSFKWCLQGIFYGDPADRGICFNKNVLFTSLHKYYEWIYSVIDSN
ncbi:uncharacterized protein LOC142983172 isoform X2 [Anticarsia gemmatalis]|uniref:uncharacterized protein LOC142983172 isoform X2 n=1 Tax=Anticarsia gemmatalis TaxID=129554 RepID=UPI003F76E39B